MDNKIVNYIIIAIVFALAVLLYVKRDALMNYFGGSSVAQQPTAEVMMDEELDVEDVDTDQD
jgi:uncharacterized membrane protein YraQ (UPF0718 family)